MLRRASRSRPAPICVSLRVPTAAYSCSTNATVLSANSSRGSDTVEQVRFVGVYTSASRQVCFSPGSSRRSNMLEDSLFESQGRKKTRKPVVVVVSVAAHVVTIVLLVLIPLLQIQAPPVPKVDLSMWLPHVQVPEPIEVFSAQLPVQKSTPMAPS